VQEVPGLEISGCVLSQGLLPSLSKGLYIIDKSAPAFWSGWKRGIGRKERR